MSYRIGQVSKLCGISTRALHHYDDIDLLKPSMRSESGYRIYSDSDLLRLQQIMFYKILGFNLEKIAELMNTPCFDYQQALVEQRVKLLGEIEHSQQVLTLIDKSLQSLNEGNTMAKDNFAAFNGFDPKVFEQEVEQKWGNTDSYKESRRRTKLYDAKDWQTIKKESETIIEQLATLLNSGLAASEKQCLAAVDAYRQHIDRWYYPCSKKMFAELGKMYVSDPRFAANFDKVEAGLAQFICSASSANADSN